MALHHRRRRTVITSARCIVLEAALCNAGSGRFSALKLLGGPAVRITSPGQAATQRFRTTAARILISLRRLLPANLRLGEDGLAAATEKSVSVELESYYDEFMSRP
jgi:hypothetical protein